MKNLKKLSRAQLKNVFGGNDGLNDGLAREGNDYMCCNRAGCSVCVTNASPSCVAGAWAVPC